MFIGQNICQDVSSPEIDLYIQYNHNHNTSQLLVEIDKQIIRHIWKCEGPGIAKRILEKRAMLENLCYCLISLLTIKLQFSTLCGVKMYG